jgi:hypothetical protein
MSGLGARITQRHASQLNVAIALRNHRSARWNSSCGLLKSLLFASSPELVFIITGPKAPLGLFAATKPRPVLGAHEEILGHYHLTLLYVEFVQHS